MPVAKMTKATILVPCEQREELVERLYRLGALHPLDLPSILEAEQTDDLAVPCEIEVRELRLAISRCDFVLELLDRFEEKK